MNIENAKELHASWLDRDYTNDEFANKLKYLVDMCWGKIEVSYSLNGRRENKYIVKDVHGQRVLSFYAKQLNGISGPRKTSSRRIDNDLSM